MSNNLLKITLGEGMVAYDLTLHFKAHDHTT